MAVVAKAYEIALRLAVFINIMLLQTKLRMILQMVYMMDSIGASVVSLRLAILTLMSVFFQDFRPEPAPFLG
jgi:hypothetical protein